jgi:transposase-like protein
MAKISFAGLRAPDRYEGINVNFCKNPKCANFGVPETPNRPKRSAGKANQPGDYTLVAAGKRKPLLSCSLCGESLPMRSNRGIHEQLTRVMRYLEAPDEASCANTDCALFTVPMSLAGNLHVQFGRSAAGTSRYRCGSCFKTLSGIGKSTKKQRMPQKNREVFALLINQMALRRMAWGTQLDRQSIYGEIEFLYHQCQAFAADRERKLREGHGVAKAVLGHRPSNTGRPLEQAQRPAQHHAAVDCHRRPQVGLRLRNGSDLRHQPESGRG